MNSFFWKKIKIIRFVNVKTDLSLRHVKKSKNSK
jgi:hypothetical protein